MIRTCLAAALVAAASLPASIAVAQTATTTMSDHPMLHHHRMYQRHMRGCNPNRSYGTGYHGCGTATGGPAGGLPSRN